MIKLKEIAPRQLQSEFIEGFDLDIFRKMTKFTERSRYAKEKLQRLTSGSGREIFKIDDKRVLKLAKNSKGIAQNGIESDYVLNDMYGDIIAKVLESDSDNRWVVSEYAKKISPSRFKALLGVTIYEFWNHLFNLRKEGPQYFMKHQVGGVSYVPFMPVDMTVVEKLQNSEFFQQLEDMIGNFDLEIGDFRRLNSFGEIDGRLVITDYGLSSSVYKNYYDKV